MWCSHCQHEVPAVVRTTRGPLVCSQCDHELAQRAGNSVGDSHPTDSGIALESYDKIQQQSDLSRPIDPIEEERTKQRMRAIGRQLRSSYRHEVSFGNSPALEWSAYPTVEPPPVSCDSELRQLSKQNAQSEEEIGPTAKSWFASMLITGGVLGLCCGLALLAWASVYDLPKMWQWGMLSTIASEGSLVMGLAWMAIRLWRNSRRLNRQMAGVDRQLAEVQQLAGAAVGSRMSSSQHYYDHFNQVASPHLLAANLRGQVEQLANRVAVGR